MPRPIMDLDTAEYYAAMQARHLHRIYGGDYEDVLWSEKTLRRLEAKLHNGDYTDNDRADFRKAKAIHAHVLAKKGYDPNQPRVSAGHSDGGQWTETGRGSGRPAAGMPRPRRKPSSFKPLRPAMTAAELARFNRHAPPGIPARELEIDPITGLPRWYAGGAVGPSVSPFDLAGAGGAARAAGNIARTTAADATAVIQVLRARTTGMRAAQESVEKIRKAADAVEDFLGGSPKAKDVIINDAKDIVITNGNKKFRMDINNPGLKKSGEVDQPHFHLQEFRNGKWRDAADGHRYYFAKEK